MVVAVEKGLTRLSDAGTSDRDRPEPPPMLVDRASSTKQTSLLYKRKPILSIRSLSDLASTDTVVVVADEPYN